ncbi:MAG: S8 family peptidase [Ignavibacteriae bacterium]|nr:S8 family peptidase [Ignavibacteriota bacterium]
MTHNTRDEYGHGTHVTGILSAESNNGTGVAGVAWECKVLCIRVFNKCGSGTDAMFKQGVIYAVDSGATVINFSGGFDAGSTTQVEAITYASNNNVLIVASSGNDNGGYVRYPAAYSSTYSNVIAVGATDKDDNRPSFSNVGLQLDVVAPGGGVSDVTGDIYSTTPNYNFTLMGFPYNWTQNYSYGAGTSMATPHVTGIAGLIHSFTSGLSSSDVRDIIRFTADKVTVMGDTFRSNLYGYGRANAFNALNAKLEGAPSAPVQLPIGSIWNASHGHNHALVKWEKHTGYDVKGYKIYRKINNSSYSYQASVLQPTTQWEDYDVILQKPNNGGTVYYYLQAYDVYTQTSASSNVRSANFLTIQPSKIVVRNESDNGAPSDYFIMQNTPNPFNPSTQIHYGIPEDGYVSLKVYNSLGQVVSTLLDGYETSGYQSVPFTADNLPSGVYYYTFIARNTVETKRMVLMR